MKVFHQTRPSWCLGNVSFEIHNKKNDQNGMAPYIIETFSVQFVEGLECWYVKV